MSFFFYGPRIPDDHFTPKTHSQDELDSLRVPPDKRDRCKDYFAEFKTCVTVVHQTTKKKSEWFTKDAEHCGYYFDHWNYCREKTSIELGLGNNVNGY